MVQKLQIDLGGRPFSVETGRVAKQANGSVMVQYGETVVLVTHPRRGGPCRDGTPRRHRADGRR